QRSRLLHSALARARRMGEHMLMCQILGDLGFTYLVAGDSDSTTLCYREGIRIADRHRFPDQAARLRAFLSQHYFDMGRLALAATQIQEAQAASRRFGGGPWEIRVVLRALEQYARLGCWEMVRKERERLPVLVRSLRRERFEPEARTYELRARSWYARWLAA